MREIVNTCMKSINRAKQLKNFNILITDTFEMAKKQAFESQKRWNDGNFSII